MYLAESNFVDGLGDVLLGLLNIINKPLLFLLVNLLPVNEFLLLLTAFFYLIILLLFLFRNIIRGVLISENYQQ
jgi:hypothetical protein